MFPLPPLTRRQWRRRWDATMVMPRSHFEQGEFCFLGKKGTIRTSTDWNSKKRSKLWLYNLHYLDDLNAFEADSRKPLHEWMIQRWTEDNPPISGNGWEAYPLSLRVVNLVKWYARQECVDNDKLQSLGRQAQALSAQVERHILANHLFANAKGLIFVGAFLSGVKGDAWLQEGLRILEREVQEQFLSDGGHFELSPMYHSILLWDLCDLVNLASSSSISSLRDRASGWREVILRGIKWLRAMSHPDGEISFFNDAAFKCAPSPDSVFEYAKKMGIELEETKSHSTLSMEYLPETGYVTVKIGESGKAILDVAEVGPRYQPGHAHADTLSFELSLFGQRILVNSGTSVYGHDVERLQQRSTGVHNTVEINGENSSQVWSGFRVAKRARPTGLELMERADGITVCSSHDGYRWSSGSPVHTRQWKITRMKLVVTDRIKGKFRSAVARFYLHPDISVENNQVLRLPEGKKVGWSVKSGDSSIVHSIWHPEFGESVESNCLEVLFSGSEITTEFAWA